MRLCQSHHLCTAPCHRQTRSARLANSLKEHCSTDGLCRACRLREKYPLVLMGMRVNAVTLRAILSGLLVATFTVFQYAMRTNARLSLEFFCVLRSKS